MNHLTGWQPPYTPLELDPNGAVARAALRECAERGHEWPAHEQDRASVLLKDLACRLQDTPGKLLGGASTAMLRAMLGLVCSIEGRNGEPVFPELRYSNIASGVVCYRAGVAAPLSTKQFEPHREYLQELWRGSVGITTGTAVGAPPGCVVVRPAPRTIALLSVPAAPQMPLALPEWIPLMMKSDERI